jgi:hypothetical protein
MSMSYEVKVKQTGKEVRCTVPLVRENQRPKVKGSTKPFHWLLLVIN